MARLKVLSGVDGKLPAAFLLEMAGRKLLFDLGEGPQAGIFPDVSGVGPVDAICLSHGHVDHVGGLHLAAALGNPLVHATQATFSNVSEAVILPERRVVIPERGAVDIAGLPFTVGRDGHAPGGVWFHTALEDGFLYMGDWSAESVLLPFDPPPPASVVVTDSSYGDREQSLSGQIDAIVEAIRTGAVLAVPSGGRGPEVALVLAQRGLSPRLCPIVRAEIERLVADPQHAASRGVFLELLAREDAAPYAPSDIIVAAEANAEAGLSAELLSRGEGFRFLFSSHVPAGTPAAELLAEGQARWLGWNVHPRLCDTLNLADRTRAHYVVTAFSPYEAMPRLIAMLGARWADSCDIAFGDDAPRKEKQ